MKLIRITGKERQIMKVLVFPIMLVVSEEMPQYIDGHLKKASFTRGQWENVPYIGGHCRRILLALEVGEKNAPFTDG